MLEMPKRQQLEDDKNSMIKPRLSNHLYLDKHNNKERQSSDRYQSKDCRYILLLLYF